MQLISLYGTGAHVFYVHCLLRSALAQPEPSAALREHIKPAFDDLSASPLVAAILCEVRLPCPPFPLSAFCAIFSLDRFPVLSRTRNCA